MRLDEARLFAIEAHTSIDQRRKYTGEPYHVHPQAVVDILVEAGETDENVLIAAYLHDVLEDVWPLNAAFSPERILTVFGSDVLTLVFEVTDTFTKEDFPILDRKLRKEAESNRLVRISDRGLKVKFADLVHNTGDILANDESFGKVYLREKNYFLERVEFRVRGTTKVDPVLEILYDAALKNTAGE